MTANLAKAQRKLPAFLKSYAVSEPTAKVSAIDGATKRQVLRQ